jgi:hypothetical protein
MRNAYLILVRKFDRHKEQDNIQIVGHDSVVSTATPYGLDCSGFKHQWGETILLPSRPAIRPTQPPAQWALGLSQG